MLEVGRRNVRLPAKAFLAASCAADFFELFFLGFAAVVVAINGRC